MFWSLPRLCSRHSRGTHGIIGVQNIGSVVKGLCCYGSVLRVPCLGID